MYALAQILKEVHSKPSFERYKDTNIRNNTTCYSHALGITSPYPEFFCRIGAISGKKAINENYFSIEEIKELLFLDCKTLQLKIKESSIEEELLDDEYKIILFVKIWANGQIGGCHFWRYGDGVWTEKWPGRGMNEIQDFEREKLDYFPWSLVGIYKISRWGTH